MPDAEGVEPKTMVIGTNNVFEVGCGILFIYRLSTREHCRFISAVKYGHTVYILVTVKGQQGMYNGGVDGLKKTFNAIDHVLLLKKL